MNRTLKYTLLSLLWGAVAVYIIWAAASARRARSERKVGRVDIEVVDSTAQGHLVSVEWCAAGSPRVESLRSARLLMRSIWRVSNG